MDSKTVGILGGGQLGRMLVEAAHRLNVKTVILDAPGCPAKQINALDDHVNGSFKDADAIGKLAKKCDVLTMEIEHVGAAALDAVSRASGVPVYPLPETIRVIKDKYAQKKHLAGHGVAIVEFLDVSENTPDVVAAIGTSLGYPFMLKARTMAYDGRGNFLVQSPEKIEEGLQCLGSSALYAEKWCPFTKELAVMVVRTVEGEVFVYPTVETIHQDNICHVVYAPARISDSLREKASILAQNAVKSFLGCGIFGVEMFLLPTHELLVNEIAPRPHNSGHYTIDACVTSQFEAHIRAVTGLPMPKNFSKLTTTNTNAIMLNVLGDSSTYNGELAICRRALETPNASVYLYGKESKPKRKVGHINIVGSSMAEVENKLAYILCSSSALPAEVPAKEKPLVSIIMGSDSDLPVMAVGADILKQFGVPFELTIVSAHRTPQRMSKFAMEAASRGIKAIIAGAGGAAHLPGMVAAMTPLPVIGVPVKGSTLDGVDSLHSIVQMPRGIPVATVAINNSTNAALLAIRILGAYDYKWLDAMSQYMNNMEQEVLTKAERLEDVGHENY
ncbi:Phosphoribosylaminoimidazole carboxylase [Metschnikowia bicuspidata]|uniref:Phosphoribosylaminoimidazole carboxylase n=1 Tax=Metschnikowia bicuspidata TaxID=27322 RepID=A0A4P9ZC62_9ASCO|nr:Phosphoribosylaminoimidazole carboxylase [Metschnikowia bicuspidata]